MTTGMFFEPAWKVDILKVFKENFANPYYATDDVPGVWFDYSPPQKNRCAYPGEVTWCKNKEEGE